MSANSTEAAALLHQVEKDDYGPMVIALFIAYALWGMIYLQVYSYYSSGVKDRLYLKIMVGVIFVLECFLTTLDTLTVYFYLVNNFSDPSALAIYPWHLNISFALRGLQMLILRCMFLLLLFARSKEWKIVTIWTLLWSLVELGTGIALTVQFFGFGPSTTFPQSFYTTSHVNEVALLVADISLAAALCYHLYKSRPGPPQIDSIISILQSFSTYIINTTVIAAVAAIVSLILSTTTGNNFIAWPAVLMQTKLYFIAYMSTLNGREQLPKQENTPTINLPNFVLPPTHLSVTETTLSVEKPSIGTKSVQTYVV